MPPSCCLSPTPARDGVEIRRELFQRRRASTPLPALAAAIERHGLLVCYSAPQALFADNGELNLHLPTLLAKRRPLTPCG